MAEGAVDRLERRHAEMINAVLKPCTGYLFRLQQRMLQVGFTPDQPIHKLVTNAYDALHELCVQFHYISCGNGTGPNQATSRQGKRGATACSLCARTWHRNETRRTVGPALG